MARVAWTCAEEQRLRELYPWHLTRELAGLLEAEGFPARGEKAVTARARLLKLTKAPEFDSWRDCRRWTEEEDQFLKEFVPGHTEVEIIDAFDERFGRRITVSQLANRKAILGVIQGTVGYRFQKGHVPWAKGKKFPGRTSSTSFKKGQTPHNERELLDTRQDPEGRTYIKVDPRNAKNTMNYWIPYAHYVWMQANGRDWPEGHRAMFADHDITNFDPENIIPVPAEVYPRVACKSKGAIDYFDKDSLEVAVTLAKIAKRRYALERIRDEHQQGRD